MSPTFTVYASSPRPTAGLSLRGPCTSADAARHLAQAVAEAVSCGHFHIWVDCRHLSAVSWYAQGALLAATQLARQAGSALIWCGFSPAVLAQLAETGLHRRLPQLPAAGYRGPAALLLDAGPPAWHPPRAPAPLVNGPRIDSSAG